MITEWFMSLGVGILSWIAPVLPHFNEVDGVVVTAGSFIVPLMSGAASLGVWVPFGTIGWCLAILAPLYVGSLLFKITRVIVAHLPFVGGRG